MKHITNKQRSYISELWFKSEIKQRASNMAIQYTKSGNDEYFTIGIYHFNDITGESKITPLTGMEKLTFEEIEKLLK